MRSSAGLDALWLAPELAVVTHGGGKELEFAAAASRILGPIAPADVRYESSGIRPKLRARHEAEEKDFVVSRDAPGLINLVGIESPRLTSALAIAALVESLL